MDKKTHINNKYNSFGPQFDCMDSSLHWNKGMGIKNIFLAYHDLH